MNLKYSDSGNLKYFYARESNWKKEVNACYCHTHNIVYIKCYFPLSRTTYIELYQCSAALLPR